MYLWIVILGGFASFYNSWGIGANDCANSFATSVGAKVLTLKQALIVASIFEFLGAFLAGSHVTSAIRKKIVNFEVFEDNPGALMLGMFCSNLSAAIWLHVASYLKLPVSTTHSIVGAIIGFSLAYDGKDSIKWDIDGGVGGIVLSWFISPILASIFALFFYLLLKTFVFNSNKAIDRTLFLFPALTLLVFTINCYFIFYKGAPQLDLDELPDWEVHTIAWITGIFISLITGFFYVPYARAKINNNSIEKYLFYNIGCFINIIGNKLNKILLSFEYITNIIIFKLHLNKPIIYNDNDNEEIEVENGNNGYNGNDVNEENENNGENGNNKENNNNICNDNIDNIVEEQLLNRTKSYKIATSNSSNSSNNSNSSLKNNSLTIDQNIAKLKRETKILQLEKLNKKIKNLHTNANIIDENVEQLFSSLQVITACASSFAHGANDVANSIAPYATIIAIYNSGEISKKNEVPLWLLFMGGIGIVFGLATWGYKIIDRIGRELTKISASRGSIIELSAALTVLIASRAEMPVSTTHCQIGAVFGCGIGDGIKNIQWKLFREIILSWLVTLPAAGFISAGLFSFAVYSPQA